MDDEQFRKIVDASGFAFQLAVETLIPSAQSAFSVKATEHAWANPLSATGGFIDVVVEDGTVRLVIECKRVRGNGQWIFLRPEGTTVPSMQSQSPSMRSQHVETLWTGVTRIDDATAFDGLSFNPESPQCPFCVIRGGGENDAPMLERLASELLQATESLAREQKAIDAANRSDVSRLWLYVPVVVTNARIVVCSFDPVAVSPTDGLLPSEAQFEEVPFVRFLKNLGNIEQVSSLQDIRQANLAKNRSVIVVHAPKLKEFLRQFRFVGQMPLRMRTFL